MIADLASACAGVKWTVGHRGTLIDRPENTLAAVRYAVEEVEVGATVCEVDVRWSQDRELVIVHDPTLNRTTDGAGSVADFTLAQLRTMTAGSWHDPNSGHKVTEAIPTLREVLREAAGRIKLLLDLNSTGEEFDLQVAAEVRAYSKPSGMILGVKTVEEVARYKRLLPGAQFLGLMSVKSRSPTVADFAELARVIQTMQMEGVKVIRLWSHWIEAEPGLVEVAKSGGAGLHLNGQSTMDIAGVDPMTELKKLLAYRPVSIASDHPKRLVSLLKTLQAGGPTTTNRNSL